MSALAIIAAAVLGWGALCVIIAILFGRQQRDAKALDARCDTCAD